MDNILENPGQAVFGIKFFNFDTTKLCLRKNPKWNKDDIEVVI